MLVLEISLGEKYQWLIAPDPKSTTHQVGTDTNVIFYASVCVCPHVCVCARMCVCVFVEHVAK